MKGVYVDIRVPDSLELRADAARLVIPVDAVACGPTAAWLHGLDTTALGPTELMEARWTRDARDVVELRGLPVTSPIATAVELAMRLPRPFALSAVDAFLRSGKADRWALRAASAAYEGRPGYRQAQDILRYADRRSASPGESWLGHRLLDAGLGVDRHDQVTSPLQQGTSTRVRAGESQLYAVWPGHYRSDLFLIDDIDTYEKAIGLQPDPDRTGLQDHEHQVEWTLDPSETNARGSYVTVRATLNCGCQIRELRTFAEHMHSQRGWDVAVTSGWGISRPDSPGEYYFRVRRKSLN